MDKCSSVTPDITISLCTYNSKQTWLNEAVQSILNQTYQNFEFLIIDDGSSKKPDFTSELYRDPRIVFVCKEKNEGLAASRNLAIKMAKGKYIAMMDDDDISLPNRLEKQFAYMEEHEEIAVLGTWFETFGDKNEVIKREINDNEYYRCCLLFGNAPTIIHPSTMIRKSALISNNIWYDSNLRKAQDYNLWSKLSNVGICTNYPEVLFKYRIHSNQISQRLRSFDVGDYEWVTMGSLFNRLGIKLTDSEVAFVRKNYTRKDVDAVEYRKWLNRILEANQNTGVYDQEKLQCRICVQWEQKVLNTKEIKDFMLLMHSSSCYEKKVILEIEKKRIGRISRKIFRKERND